MAAARHQLKWCRARLLHALASAHEQGVLGEVIDEILPCHIGTADDLKAALARSLKAWD